MPIRGLFTALAEARSAEIARLAAEAARALGCDGGLGAAEAVLRAGLLKLGGSMLGQLLSADPGQRGPRVLCGQGHEAEFTDYRDKTFDTVLGPVTLRRAWYRCAECKHGFAPRDTELGVAGASLSPGLAAMNDIAAATGPFAKAAGLLEDLAGVQLTVKRVERAAEASGAAQAAAVRERSAADRQPEAGAAAAAAAGGHALRRDRRHRRDHDRQGNSRAGRKRRGRAGPHPRGQARRVLHPGRHRRGRLPGAGPRLLQLHRHLRARRRVRRHGEGRGIRRGADHVRQLTILGDGAAWIWNIAAGKFPGATQVVDLFHAREHLNSLTRSLEFMLPDRKDQWLAARLEDLDYGDIDGIEAAIHEYPLEGVKKDEVEKEPGYFLNNAPRMRYRWFRSAACSPAPASSNPAASRSSASASSSPACAGPPPARMPSPPLRCPQASRPKTDLAPTSHPTVPA